MESSEDVMNLSGGKDAYSVRVCTLIKTVVSSYFDLPMSAFDSKSRLRVIIKMKQTSVYFVRKALPKATLKYIGEQIAGYDHATVLHSLKSIDNLLVTDRETRTNIEEIDAKLQSELNNSGLGGEIGNDYYYINMNTCVSIKLKSGKAILLVGYTPQEVANFVDSNKINQDDDEHKATPISHANTGLYILQKNKKDEKR